MEDKYECPYCGAKFEKPKDEPPPAVNVSISQTDISVSHMQCGTCNSDFNFINITKGEGEE